MHNEPENAADVVREREALEELLKTDGWRVFASRALREWQGRGYVIRMKGALGGTDPALSASVVDRTADEIVRLLQWPADRVEELKGIVDE